MAEWVRGLVKGFKGGQAVIRFVSVGGILLGLDDLIKKLSADLGSGSVRAKVEDELIVALSEIVELYGAPKDSAWEKEFQPETEQGECECGSCFLPLHALQLTRFSGCPLSRPVIRRPILTPCLLGTYQGPATLRMFPLLHTPVLVITELGF